MPRPYVTNVTSQNNQIVITVKVNGFPSDEPIEISGYATQNDGALAVFYDLQPFPAPNPDGTAYVYLTASPTENFKQGHPVTVVLRMSRVWTTVLEEEEPEEPSPVPVENVEPTEGGTAWSYIKAVTYAAPFPGG
jgi:hypothetical protein